MIAEFSRWARYAQTVLKARGVAIGLLDAEALRCVATSGLFVPDVGSEFSKDGLAWSSVSKDVALHSEDLVANPQTAAQECIAWGARSVVLAPIHDDGEVRGVLVGVSDASRAFSVFAAGTAERLANEMSAMLALFWSEPEPQRSSEPPPTEYDAPPAAGESQALADTDREHKPAPSAFLSQSATYLVQPVPAVQDAPSGTADDAENSRAPVIELTSPPPPPPATALPEQMPTRGAAVPRPRLVPRPEEPEETRPAPSFAPAKKSDTPSWYPEPDYSGLEASASPVRPRSSARTPKRDEPPVEEEVGATRAKVWGMRIFLVVWILIAGATTWRLRDAMWMYLAGTTPPSAEAAGADNPTDETKAVMRRRAKPSPSSDSQRHASGSSRPSSAPAPQPARSTAGFAATPSRLLLRVEPTYPADARSLHISGTVVLEAQVRKDGSVGTIKFVSGDTAFRQAALDAVRQWKYQPATLDGVPIDSTAIIDLQFAPQ